MIKLRRMRRTGHVARRGEEEYVWSFGGKARRNTRLWSEDNVKMDFTEIGWMVCVGLI
jgi:hypothetical protein